MKFTGREIRRRPGACWVSLCLNNSLVWEEAETVRLQRLAVSILQGQRKRKVVPFSGEEVKLTRPFR